MPYSVTAKRQRNIFANIWSAVVDNIRGRIVGAMFPPTIFVDRCVNFRRSMVDVSTFEDRCVHFEDRCVDLR